MLYMLCFCVVAALDANIYNLRNGILWCGVPLRGFDMVCIPRFGMD